MHILALLVISVVISILSPGLATAIAWLLTLGFIVPFFTFAGGTLAWAIINIFTAGAYFTGAAWLSCCMFIGLPAGLMMAWFVLAD